ncbi:putative gustatory receptor 32a [Lucilia cuprina]|uniref:Gustatory receptor n=1 Tax=Lucilia cuprina TaxID=7375 RepID=A0A0L0CP53_LUCCU|nr:Gustatory and pheromone receptor 32a [Lucilia cuprina]KNC34138.1 putative gustatory receptor 32a [Lucilia cuprina]
MCPGPWTVNMSGEKVKSSPVRQTTRSAFMMDSNNNESETFLSDITDLLYILKATGLLPFYRTISNYELGPPSVLSRIYTITAHLLIHSMTIYNVYNLFTDGSTQLFYSYRETDNINYWIEILLCIVTYTTTVFLCFRNGKSYLNILNDTLKVDEEISRKFSINMVNNCGFAIKYIIIIVIFQVYIIILKILSIKEPLNVASYILISFYSFQNGLSSIFIVYASVLLRIITVRFEFLNKIITGYTYREQKAKVRQRITRVNNGDIFSQPRSMENFPDESLFAFRMYNKLLRLYKAVNECCSLTLVVYMGYAFYSITTTTYNLFVQITTQMDSAMEMSVNVLQICFVLLFTNTIMLAVLSRCAGQATDQANETSEILARVYGKSKEYQNIVDKFLTKSIKQEVQFTAYGFFVIDNSTLFKIFSAVTTYLVILIQFKQLEESKTVDASSQKSN